MATTKMISQAEIDLMISKENKTIVTFQGEVFDVTDFASSHPGGSDLIEDYNGEDISLIFYDPDTHDHTRKALQILNGCKIGHLSEERVKHKTKDSLKIYPKMDENYVATYNGFSIDFKKPLVMQTLVLSKEHYLHFIHNPVYLPYCARLFYLTFFEMFSWNRWWYIPMTWTPVILFYMWLGTCNAFGGEFFLNKYYRFDGPDFSYLIVLMTFLLGTLVWTKVEYILHRWLFHMDEYVPDFRVCRIVHFTIHGIHHTIPMDPLRLVFPPILAAVFALFLYPIITNLFIGNMGAIVMSGGLTMYILYDLMHFFLHHGNLKWEYLKEMRNYHNKHHFQNPRKGYGVSNKFWDYVWRTQFI